MQYVIEKCLEEMCKDEPFGIYDYGSVEDLRGLTRRTSMNTTNTSLKLCLCMFSFPVMLMMKG